MKLIELIDLLDRATALESQAAELKREVDKIVNKTAEKMANHVKNKSSHITEEDADGFV